MSLWETVKRSLSADETYSEFELLETEQGAPPTVVRQPKQKDEPETPGTLTIEAQSGLQSGQELAPSLDGNVNVIYGAFGGEANEDVILRRFRIAGSVRAALFFITGMANLDRINNFILRQAMKKTKIELEGRTMLDYVEQDVVAIGELKRSKSTADIIQNVLDGLCVMLVDGESEALIIETPGFDKRSISEPTAEKVVRGPQEGFTENIRSNVTLIRRIVRTPDLRAEFTPLGGENNLKCALMYREELVNKTLLGEVKKRLANMKMHYMIGEGMLQQLIETNKHSPFAQALSTERPDRAAMHIMQGCVAIVCDSSPFVCIVPVTVSSLFNTSEDVFLRPVFGAISRLIRYVGIFISLYLPALFVAIMMYHPELISLEMLYTVLESRRMISTPIYLEIFLMLFIFQLVRESGMRVPGSMGQAVGVIGGLIMGQASTDANITSPVALIIVALTGLGTYVIPMYSMHYTVVFFRIAFLLAAAVAGLPGIVAASVVSIAYFASVKSFGVPMLAPFAPKTYSKGPTVLRAVLSDRQGPDDFTNTDGNKKKQGGKS